MKYVDPQITDVLEADSAIQGLEKGSQPTDSDQILSPGVGYRADE
jgi:hypothetical protein